MFGFNLTSKIISNSKRLCFKSSRFSEISDNWASSSYPVISVIDLIVPTFRHVSQNRINPITYGDSWCPEEASNYATSSMIYNNYFSHQLDDTRKYTRVIGPYGQCGRLRISPHTRMPHSTTIHRLQRLSKPRYP